MKFIYLLPALLLLSICFAQNATSAPEPLSLNCSNDENITNASECENISQALPAEIPAQILPEPAPTQDMIAELPEAAQDAPAELPPDLYADGAQISDSQAAYEINAIGEELQTPEEGQIQATSQIDDENIALAAQPKAAATGAQESEINSFLQKNAQEMIFFALGALSIIALAIFAFYFRHTSPPAYPQELSIGETQMQILDELAEVQKIPTDISRSVQKSKSTVVEHLDSLCRMGLVERIAFPAKKFVYYRLTQQGRLFILKRRQAA